MGSSGALAQPADTLSFALLTCSPGSEVYSLYGHTALRVWNGNGMDLVFNYGVFDFKSDHFLWRFVLGKTDYQVVAVPTSFFLQTYEREGRGVEQQRLNLTPQEGDRLIQFLLWNAQPENRVYRYNYLTNNCATKVLDAISQALDGRLEWPDSIGHRTYRGEIHRYNADHLWARLGNDLLLGADCDTLISASATIFLPFPLQAYVDTAMVVGADGGRRLLADSATTLVPVRSVETEPGFLLRPRYCAWLFVLLRLADGDWEKRRGRVLWAVDVPVMLAQGLAGVLLVFMFCFSEHPTVDSNWQILLFNPVPLVCLPWVISRAYRHQFCLYHPLNVLYLAGFLIFSAFIKQEFAEIVVPLTFGIALRSASYCINTNR